MMFRILFILMIFSLPAYAQEKPSEQAFVGDARGLIWGLSPEDVQAYEEAEETSRFLGTFENRLSYIGKDFGKNAYLTYHFFDNKLGRIVVEYDYRQANPQDYLNDYIDLQRNLSELYGEPSSDNIIWKDDQYKNDLERWGLAVMLGDVEFQTIWSTPSSIIRMVLRGGDMKADTETVYVSRTVLRQDDSVSLIPQNTTSE